ncbi:chromosomal replication initiator protein DnaA [bacterium]|nr:chromosomal replication initiator protein DnaA [bacterium]
MKILLSLFLTCGWVRRAGGTTSCDDAPHGPRHVDDGLQSCYHPSLPLYKSLQFSYNRSRALAHFAVWFSVYFLRFETRRFVILPAALFCVCAVVQFVCVHAGIRHCFFHEGYRGGGLVTNCTVLWGKVLEVVKAATSSSIFQSFFSVVTPLSLHDDRFIIQVDSPIVADWLKQKYAALLEQSLTHECGRPIHLVIQCDMDAPPALIPTPAEPEERPAPAVDLDALRQQRISASNLNPSHLFSTFIVGSSNQMAHAAAFAVSQNPGRTYNPLFIYGGVGLGKTHLMNAVGNAILARDPHKRVQCLTCEQFANQYIAAIQSETIPRFREFYRANIDVLLIDDIQFLSTKERMQEEFFYTFNALHHDGKQIIMTSDKSPQELQHIENRLLNRFEWGMVVDIQSPDFETRVAIIRKKLETHGNGVQVDDEVCNYLAHKVLNDVRKIEGALIKLFAYASLHRLPITLDLARDCLKDYISSHTVNLEHIQKVVADFFDIRLTDLRSNRRPRTIAHPRQLAMYLCRDLTNSSLTEIAQSFGGKDHTTVLYACRKIDTLKSSDQVISHQLDALKKRILESTARM